MGPKGKAAVKETKAGGGGGTAKKAGGGVAAKKAAELEAVENESAADALRRQGVVTTCAISARTIHRNCRDIHVENLTTTYHGAPLIEEAGLVIDDFVF